jgi:hypothetical protein
MSKSEVIQFRVTPEEKKELFEKVDKFRFQDLTEMILFIVFNAKIHCDVGFKENITFELGRINDFKKGNMLTEQEFKRAKDAILSKYEKNHD